MLQKWLKMVNQKSVQWRRFIILVTLMFTSTSFSSRPPRIDLGFVIDATGYMTNSEYTKSIQLIKNLVHGLSISPSTTRVGVYTVNDKLMEQFSFDKYVNRECLMRRMEILLSKSGALLAKKRKWHKSVGARIFQKTTTTKLLKKALSILKRKSRNVFGQRRIFIFVTASWRQMLSLKANVLTNSNAYGILIAKRRAYNIHSKLFVYAYKNDYVHIADRLKLNGKDYSTCFVKGPTLDECERKCECVNGKFTDCYRVREEITTMSKYKRRRYLRVYQLLTSLLPYKERYEKLIFMHLKYFYNGIHGLEFFLPWHRMFLLEMENLLRTIDCRITIPYWDWSAMSKNPWNPILWSEEEDDLGGNGDKNKGFCVQTGLFQVSKWKTPYWEDGFIILNQTSSKAGIAVDKRYLINCLRRRFNTDENFPSVYRVIKALNIPVQNFSDFNAIISGDFHNNTHNNIGGTMETDYAANAPEFFLHHSFIDKIWYMWQKQSEKHKNVYFKTQNLKLPGFDLRTSALIESHNLPGCLKVLYTNPRIK